MKNLISLNRSGMSPGVTCRKGRHAIDSILSRFCVVSLIYANKLLNHRTTPLGRFVLPEHLPFSKPKVNWLLHVSLICLCMLTVGVGNVLGTVQSGWTRVTTTAEITAGGTFIIGYEATANTDVIVPLRSDGANATTSAQGYLYSGTTKDASTTGTIDMSSIATTSPYEVTIAASSVTDGAITIQMATGNYIGTPPAKNTAKLYTSATTTNTDYTVAIGANDVVTLTNVEGEATQVKDSKNYYYFKYFRYNTASGSQRFAHYRTGQADVVMYKKTSSCSSLTQTTVTATPGDRQIALSWPEVSNASSYTVTCKVKSSGSSAGTIGSVTGTTTKYCTITGLTNTTEYTWSVMPVGDGSTYCASNTPATGDATPNIYYTVTWMVNGSSYTTTSVADGDKPTFPTNPSSCDGTSTAFYGWATATWTGKINDVSAKNIYLAGGAMPDVSGAVTYHAVFAKESTTAFERITSADNIYVGQKLAIVSNKQDYILPNNFAATTAATHPNSNDNKLTVTSAQVWTITDIDEYGYYKLKNSTTQMGVNQTSGISSGSTAVGNYSTDASWWAFNETTDFDYTVDDCFYIYNWATNSYYNFLENSGSSWLSYYATGITSGNKVWYAMKLYQPERSEYLTTCCTELGSINGSFTSSNLSQSSGVLTATLPNASKNANATSYRFTLYNNSDVEITHTDVATGGGDVSTTFSSPNVTAGNTYKVSVTPLVSPLGSYCSTTGTESDKASITMHYTVTLAVNNAEYGSISPTSTLYVASGTSISASTNTLSVGATDITATYTPQTAQYTYGFTNWTWSPSSSTITANTTATANFSRSTRTYNVTTTGITHATASPAIPATVAYGGSITTTITADANYSLPSAITVTGATLDSWNSSTGALSITDVTGDVSITITAVTAMKRIYMNTGGTAEGKWGKDSPKFFVHSWGSSNDDAELVAQPCASNVFYADIPAANTSLLFTRQDPSKGSSIIYKDNDGNWGQSVDITISTNNYFTFNGNWDVSSSGKSGFDAGTYTPDMKTIYLSFCAEWLENNPLFALYDVTHSTWMSTFAEAGTGCYAGYYIAQVPSCATTVLIGRFKPGTPAPFGWSGENWWGQSVDFTIGSDTYDKITIEGWGTEGDAKDKGYGSLGNFALTQYTISFAGGGGTGSMSSLTNKDCGSDVTLSNVGFTKTGYNFDGWHADVDVKVGGATIPAGSTIANQATLQDIRSNVALTAQWAAKEYTITLDREGASTGSENVTMTYNSSSHTAITAPTKTGYNFGGWYSGDNGTGSQVMNASGVLQANVDGYTGADGVWTRTTTPTTLYAKWIAKEYTITLDREGASTGAESMTATYDAGTLAGWSAPSKTGYTFGGYWSGDNGTGTLVISTTGVLQNSVTISAVAWTDGSGHWVKDGGATVYAKWTANVYNITYKDQGDVAYSGNATAGVPTGAPTTHTYGSATALVNGVKDGYRFDGWFTDASCTVSAGSSIGATAKTADFTLYAKWTQVYTVTWSVNGDTWESGVVEGNTHVPGGSKVSALPTAPTKSDCDDAKVFMGWRAYEIDGTSVSDPGGIFTTQAGSPTISADKTFYAVFADKGKAARTTLYEEPFKGTAGSNTDWASAGDYFDNANTASITTTTSWKVSKYTTECSDNDGASGGSHMFCGSASGNIIFNFGNKSTYTDLVLSFNYRNNAGGGLDRTISCTVSGDGGESWSDNIIDVASVTTQTWNAVSYNISNSSTSALQVKWTATANNPSRVDDIKLTGCLITYSNYVTSCASCDADATFTNTTPAVSDIDCTSATLTATGGLATVGADGCHVSDYGFVIGTSDNPVIGGSGVTKLQVGTSDPTIGDDFSYDATGLTKGTRYYIRAYAINRHGTAYSTSTNFWTKNVSSIAITTAPTKTNYIVGETFDATGMVVTATMASGATEDVTSDVTYSSSALTAGTSQNFAINYSLCETEKSVNQTINVYTLSVSEGTNPSYGDYSTSTNVITVNPGSGKTYSLSVTNATAVDNMDGTYSIINPTGNVTVTINYRDATTVKVYYKVDGKTVIEQDVTESTTATLPTASAVAIALAANDLELPEGTPYTNLWGWSESEFTPQTDEPTIVNSPTINATKTFYAVYTNMYKKSIVGSVFSGTYSDNDGEKTIDGLTYQVSNICKQSEQIQFRSTPGYLYSTSALSYINKIEITGLDLIVNACSDNEGTLDGDAITPTGSDKYVYTFPANKQYFKITGKGGTDKVSRIDIYYATATPKFMTTFCDDKVAAPTVTDTKSYTATNKATVTLSWDEVSGATGYKVKWGSVSNSWEDVGTALTYSKENLSSGSTYKWFVKAKYDAENDCGAEITKGSTTVNTAYEVAYDANTTGYTGTEPEGGFYESGETITLSTTELAASRFHWDGWEPYNMETSAAIPVSTGTFTMPAADVLIQGQWTEVLSGDEVYITSAKDITTMSSMDIAIIRATYKSGTMTISNQTGDQGGTFSAVITGADADASDGLVATVKIEYTPTKANVTESATMTAVIGSESYDFTVYGRSLPTDFVVVAKVGGVWTALPADATSSALQQGYTLTLDNTTTPTKATLAPAAALFNYYAKSAKATTDYIRLAGKENSKALWSSTSNGIKVYAAIDGGSATGNQYEWKLSTSNNTTYTLHNDAANSGGGRDLGVNGDNKWGMHASATTTELYFLPVDATAEHIAMTVTSWGEYSFTFTTSDVIPSHDHVAVECNGKSYAASMTGSGPYTISIPLMDFSDYSGASLVVQWISDEDVVLAQGAVLLPIFITGDNTDFEGYDPDILSSTDVHIVNGSTLTITTNGLSVYDLSIEGGSTLNISTTGGGGGVTFSMHSLYLRGGWNDDYTDYDMPRVYIDPKSTLSKSVITVNFDISVNHYNYYPIAVPFRVRVKDVDYANSTLAYYSEYGPTEQYVIKEYNGARRAEVGPDQANNWKVVPQEDGSGNDVYLEPGRGYILTAVSLPSYGGGIIRFPLSFTNAWTTKGEQGTVSDVTKNVIAVTAYVKAEGETKNANKGWNLLGVPFMSCYGTSAGMYNEDNVDDPASIIQGKFDFKTGDWKEEDVRYVNVPVHDFSEYIQTDITDASSVLRPGWCFFVQIATSGNLKFLTADQAASSSLPIYAPRREQTAMPTLETGIILSDGEKSDKTTFLISDKYSATEYEINADLEKMFGNGYTLATYSLSGATRLAYNALSNADAANIIPIGYRAPADGEYTFSINPRYAESDAFEHINLIDYTTGIVTDLLQYSYTFTTERTQNDARFALNVVPRQETPTGIENGANGANDANGVRKLLIDGKMYIILNGKMFDATGKKVREINK